MAEAVRREQKPLACIVADLRRELRLYQRELSARSGVSRALIDRVEHGRDVRLSTLERIAESVHARLVLVFEFQRPIDSILDEEAAKRHLGWITRAKGFRRGMRRSSWER